MTPFAVCLTDFVCIFVLFNELVCVLIWVLLIFFVTVYDFCTINICPTINCLILLPKLLYGDEMGDTSYMVI